MSRAPLTMLDVEQLLATHDAAGLMLCRADGRLAVGAGQQERLVRELLRLARLGALVETDVFKFTADACTAAAIAWERLTPP